MAASQIRGPHNQSAGPLKSQRQLTVAILLLCALAGVASAQPFPTTLLDMARVIGPDQRGTLTHTASAIGDSSGLVVWNNDGHVKGCLTASGRTSSTAACIDISGPNECLSAYKPLDAARSADGYLVVWLADEGATLRGAILSLDGAVVVRETVARYTVGWALNNPAVSFDGTNYLVAWEEYNGDYSWVLCTRVSPAGEVLDSPHRVCPSGAAQAYVSLAFGDSCYLAAYAYWTPGRNDSAGIRCSRILPSGVVLDSAGIPVRHWPSPGADNTQTNTTVGFDGANFVVGWSDYTRTAGGIRATRVTHSGAVLDPEGIEVAPDHRMEVSSACVRDTTLFVWTRAWNDTVTISGRRLCGGRLLDTSDIVITPPVCVNHSDAHPAFASLSRCGEGFLVTYEDHPPHAGALYGTRDVYGRRVSASGQVLDTAGMLLSFAANYQTEADVASDGQDYLAVWTDLRSGVSAHDCAVYGMRFTNDGVALDSCGLRISQWASHTPSIAYGAGCYLVSWLTDLGEDSAQVWATRVGPDGAPLDSSPIRLPGRVLDFEAGAPDVAFGDSLFLVVWDPGGTGCAEGARVGADGALLDSVSIMLVTPHQGIGNTPRVASDGHDFLVVWTAVAIRRVCALRVGSSGQILDTAAIVIDRYSGEEHAPLVAYGAGVFLVAEPVASDRAWRVTPAGVVLDTILWDRGLGFPRVIYDGSSFFLVDAAIWSGDGLSRGFHAMRISPQGEVIDSQPFTIVDMRTESTYLTEDAFGLAADLQGHVGMAFPTFQSDPYVAGRMRAASFPAMVGAIIEQGYAQRRWSVGARIVSRATPLVVSEPAVLLDVSGRELCDMKSGKYDMRGRGPGVYLLRADSKASVTKLVVIP
jgi:hypothetical protein